MVGEGGIGATLKRIPHIVTVYEESGRTYVRATQPEDIDRAALIEEDKRYRREIASRKAAKARMAKKTSNATAAKASQNDTRTAAPKANTTTKASEKDEDKDEEATFQ